MNSRGGRAAALATATGLAMLGNDAQGAGPLGPDGAPIRTSSYSVDLTQTPVLASSRVTGLAGAYVAIAEGIDGDTQTPVAPAVRTPNSLEHFDYELGLGLTLPATLTSTDFFNTGHQRTVLSNAKQQRFVFLTPALNLAWGTFGLGATAEISNYSLARRTGDENAINDDLSTIFVIGHVQAANAFAHGQFVGGVGLRVVGLNVTDPQAPASATNLFATLGAGVELGALWMPMRLPFRIGAAFRSGVSNTPAPKSPFALDAQGDRVVGNPSDPVNAFWLPNQINQAWDLNVGAAVQLGPRPMNPEWIDPEIEETEERTVEDARSDARARRRAIDYGDGSGEGLIERAVGAAEDSLVDADRAEAERRLEQVRHDARRAAARRRDALPRRYFLVSASLLVTGPLANAVGVESFLERVVARSGGSATFSPRLGVETEMVPNFIRVRAGTYEEPSRFATSSSRLHGTLGFDVKVLPWTVFGLFDPDSEWRLTTSGDVAARYFGWGVSIGIGTDRLARGRVRRLWAGLSTTPCSAKSRSSSSTTTWQRHSASWARSATDVSLPTGWRTCRPGFSTLAADST